MTLRILDYGNCCKFLIMGNAGFTSPTVIMTVPKKIGLCAESSGGSPGLPEM